MGLSDRQAIYSRLSLIDCSIVARCVRAQAVHGSSLDPNLANSHSLLTARNLKAPMATTRRHDARWEIEADTAETVVIAGAPMFSDTIKSRSRTTFPFRPSEQTPYQAPPIPHGS